MSDFRKRSLSPETAGRPFEELGFSRDQIQGLDRQ